MELVYRVIRLSFSDQGQYLNPIARVRVMPAESSAMSAAFVDITVKATPDDTAAASPQAAADAALQAARELLSAEAVRRHLAPILALEEQQRQQQDAALRQSLGLNPD